MTGAPRAYPEAEAVRELVTAGLRHAEGLTAQLAKLDWRPGRAHIEQARNSIQKLAELLDQQSDEVGAYALALEQALHHAPAQGSGDCGAWQPIETAPRDTNVLMAWRYDGVWELMSGWAGSTRGGWLHGQATHWMPLPAPPSVPSTDGATP